MEVEGGGEVDARVSLYDRMINAYGEARQAIKSVLALGQGEKGGRWRDALSSRLEPGGSAGAGRAKGHIEASHVQRQVCSRWQDHRHPCSARAGLLIALCAAWRLARAGGADSAQLRGELMALDRAVQGLVLERTIQVCGCVLGGLLGLLCTRALRPSHLSCPVSRSVSGWPTCVIPLPPRTCPSPRSATCSWPATRRRGLRARNGASSAGSASEASASGPRAPRMWCACMSCWWPTHLS